MLLGSIRTAEIVRLAIFELIFDLLFGPLAIARTHRDVDEAT